MQNGGAHQCQTNYGFLARAPAILDIVIYIFPFSPELCERTTNSCHTKHRSTAQTIKIFISLDRMVEVFVQRAKVHQIKIFGKIKRRIVIEPPTMPHKINCRVIKRSDATPPSAAVRPSDSRTVRRHRFEFDSFPFDRRRGFLFDFSILLYI